MVDDCSNDGSREYLSEVAKKDSRLKCFFNSVNLGACASRNVAIGAAKGEYITGLDDDDFVTRHHVKNYVDAVGLIGTDSVVALTVPLVHRGMGKRSSVIKREKIITFSMLNFENRVGNQLFLPTEKIRGLFFDECLTAMQDLDLWLRLLAGGGVVRRLSVPTYVWDQAHGGQTISKQKPWIDKCINRILGKSLMGPWRAWIFYKFYSSSNGPLTNFIVYSIKSALALFWVVYGEVKVRLTKLSSKIEV